MHKVDLILIDKSFSVCMIRFYFILIISICIYELYLVSLEIFFLSSNIKFSK